MFLKMPRPGPRPYECVRRAWHCDRHQPVRGSLIQEIFRIVNEVHCSATKKNIEWQEKLPIVVLKAEEIMYSKADSEAEYSDILTLWDRVNDAINTIIRRDESTETGKFLPPCIEAALHLGCNPRRSSRSQRNDSPTYYLRPEKLEDASVPNCDSETKAYRNDRTISPLVLHCPPYSTLDTMNPNKIKKFRALPKKFTRSGNHNASAQTSSSSNLWSVYPLYNNNQIRPDDPKSKPSNSNSHLMQSDAIGPQQKFPPLKLEALGAICPSDHEYTSEKRHRIECDLTLRLGSLVVPYGGIENSWPVHVENGNRSTPEGRKFNSNLNK